MFSLAPTPFDVRLVAFGIPIRVHPTFWIAMILLGWDPERPQYTFIWVVCGFISILVHELGHAVTAEWFGWQTDIVMYFGGGLAISDRHRNSSEWRNVVVSFMGPCAGFLFYAQLRILWYILAGYFGFKVGEYGIYAFRVLLFLNLFWGLFNLLPVLPLDGGHICQSLCTILRVRNPYQVSLTVGAVVGGAAAYYFFKIDEQFAGTLMLLMCLQNVMALQSRR